jgi:hypothetical protein
MPGNCFTYRNIIYCHVISNYIRDFGLMIGFIGHLYRSWLRVINHYHTQTNILSHVAWKRFPTADVPLLPGSRPRRLVTISCQPLTTGFSCYFLQLLAPGLSSPTAASRLTQRWLHYESLGTDRTQNIASNSYSIVACSFVAAGTICLQSRYLAATAVLFDSTIIAFTKYVTMSTPYSVSSDSVVK